MAFRIIILTLAALLDVFEMFIEIAMSAFGATAAGAAGGCAAGAYVAGQTGCAVGAALGGLVGFFSETTGAGVVAGAILGYVLDIGLTLSLGVLLVSLLLFSGRLNSWSRWMYTFAIILIRLVPLGNVVPMWTKYAWDCSATPEKPKSKDAEPASDTLLQPYAQAA